ncbi:hypothetical protein KKA69_05625 [Patescibacteria group bacterium]|nr:hypothetical protein [Patescibacteria group bacterium]
MKKVINGKIYDTKTADVIDEWSSHHNCGDFGHSAETLYRTKRGAFFVYGEGGPLTKWSIPVGSNGRGGSADIEALTRDEALRWCEERNTDSDRITELFGLEDA